MASVACEAPPGPEQLCPVPSPLHGDRAAAHPSRLGLSQSKASRNILARLWLTGPPADCPPTWSARHRPCSGGRAPHDWDPSARWCPGLGWPAEGQSPQLWGTGGATPTLVPTQGSGKRMLTLCMAASPAPASYQTLFGPTPAREAPLHPHLPGQSPGFPERSPGAQRPQPASAYPVLSLQHLLTAARGPGLAPGHRWAWWSRGLPVLLGRLWLRLWHLPQEGLKQTLPAVHLQPLGGLACTSGALGVGAHGYLGPSGRGRPRQDLRGSSSSHCPDSAGWASARDTQQGRPPWVCWVPSSYSHSSPHGQARPEQLGRRPARPPAGSPRDAPSPTAAPAPCMCPHTAQVRLLRTLPAGRTEGAERPDEKEGPPQLSPSPPSRPL